MSMKIVGIKATKRLLDQLEDLPSKIANDVLKDCVDDALKIIRKYAPKDTGSGIETLEVLQYKTDGERYFSYEIGFDGNKFEIWKGLWFQNFFGEHTDEKNIGWMQKASKEINTLVNRRLEKAINQYLRSLGG